MNSRRRFLQAGLPASLSALPLRSKDQAASQSDSPASDTTVQRDYWNDFPNYLAVRVNAARLRRKTELARITASEAAQQRNSAVRAKVWELIGGRIESSPLNPQSMGVIERPDYRVEKIIFESQPEFYVPAHLYLPRAKPPFPGILAPLGHASNGKAYRSYQTLFQNLARKGFAVFTWDPPGQGERFQYIDPATNKSRFGPTGEHDRFGWPALLIGSTTTQFEVVDGMRALDYLLSRPEIDSGKIGCCGHSGGGTQTMYLCALEPRIHVAIVVEGHTENLAGANYQPPGAYADAEQNLIGGLREAVDRGDLLCAFAPKPLLICYTPIDAGTTYSPHYVQGTREIYEELKHIYNVYGAAEKVGLFGSTLPHDYDYFHRRATYEWFNKWLKNGTGNSDESNFDDAPESTLWCTSTGQVLTSIGGRAAFQVNSDRLHSIRAHSESQAIDAVQLRSDLRRLLAIPERSQLEKLKTLSNCTLRDMLIEEFEFASEPGIRVPGWFLKPRNGGPKFPALLVLHDDGKDDIFDEFDPIEQLVRNGNAVCSVDLRTSGVTAPHLPPEGPRFYGHGVELAYSLVSLAVGAPIIGQQTCDLLRTLDYLESRNDIDPQRLAVIGTGRSGLASIFAAALDERIHALLLHRTLVDFESVVSAETYNLPLSAVAFGLLRKFDLPEICSTIAPRKLWFVNSAGAQAEPLPLSEVHARYAKVTAVYGAASRPGNLSFAVESGSIDSLVLEWAQKAFA